MFTIFHQADVDISSHQADVESVLRTVTIEEAPQSDTEEPSPGEGVDDELSPSAPPPPAAQGGMAVVHWYARPAVGRIVDWAQWS